MSNPIEVDAILDLARFAGPGAASRLAEGRSIFNDTDAIELSVGRGLLEALDGYGVPGKSEVDHPFADTMSAIRNLPDGIHNHPRSEEPLDGLAQRLLEKSVQIGELIPRLQLAIRDTQDMAERAGIVAVLDRALDAHRELSEWTSRAGAYNVERAEAVVSEFDSLIAEIQGKAAAPFADVQAPMRRDVELGEGF